MNRKLLLHLFLLSLVSFVMIGYSAAKTVVVSDAAGLVAELSLLDDGDTLQLTASEFIITSTLASEGLFIASSGKTPYQGISIIGAGMDATIIDFSNSYGFFAYYSEDLLLKDLTIKNATKNGGVYAQSAEVNLENVRIDSCKNLSSAYKVEYDIEANGGGVFYDANSTFSSIKGCVFTNNYAQDNGGAIAYMNLARLYPQGSYIENCQFYNNSSEIGGSALYLERIYSFLYINSSVFYNNINTPAIYANAVNTTYARLYLKNNSIVLNAAGGISTGSSLRTRFYLDNNAIIDNAAYDLKRSSSSTKYTGNYNVVRTAADNAFVGYFNQVIKADGRFFVVENDSLKHTLFAADYLTARVPEASKLEHDLYGDTCLSPADIGAINIQQGAAIAVWTGNENHNFFDSKNWKNALVPTGSGISSSVKKIVISDCDLNNYPIISDSITEVNGGFLAQTDMRITPTGIFENRGSIRLDTLYVESQNGGTGQLLNSGTIIDNKRLAEFYIASGKWTPIYISDASISANQLLPDYDYNDDYDIIKYGEGDVAYVSMLADDKFDLNQGYLVKSNYDLNAVFETSDIFNNDFIIQYTEQANTLNSGWNLIANPYGASVDASEVLQNVGNESAASGAIYTYDGSRFKVWVDGVGDEEASVIAPYEAFYVKALGNSEDIVNFAVEEDNVILVANDIVKSSEIQREGMLTIGLATSNNSIYDKTFLRFNSEASESFDYSYDALKMKRLEGVQSSLIYTNNEGGMVDYAVNTQNIQSDAILSIPITLDFVPSTITSSLSRRLRFFISGGDSISYLFHDALKDSSESEALTNGKIISLTTGTDALALKDRFSLQVFDGKIPDRAIASHQRKAVSAYETITNRPDTLYDTTTETFLLRRDTVWDNMDALYALAYMVDSIYIDSIFANATYTDSIFYDTTFMDTTRLWGTYQFVETDTAYASLFKRSTEYSDASITSGVYFNKYTVYDTLFVAGLHPAESSLELINVYADHQSIYISSQLKTNLSVKVFNLSGMQILSVVLPSGAGVVQVPVVGAYIVCVEQGADVMSEKIIICN